MWRSRGTNHTGGPRGGPPTTASYFNPSYINNKNSVCAPHYLLFKIGFWNCEGIARNRLGVQYIVNGFSDILCLSEVNGSDSTINMVLKEYNDIKFCSSNEVDNNLGRSAILWKSRS